MEPLTEYKLSPEELATFNEIGTAITLTRGNLAGRRAELMYEVARIDQQMASVESQAVGALKAICSIRGLEGEWSLDHDTGALRKVIK